MLTKIKVIKKKYGNGECVSKYYPLYLEEDSTGWRAITTKEGGEVLGNECLYVNPLAATFTKLEDAEACIERFLDLSVMNIEESYVDYPEEGRGE